MSPVLVTGAAGFIGYHVASRYLADGAEVVGVDCVSDYYDPALKRARLARLEARPGFTSVLHDLADAAATRRLFETCRPELVIHLAAQPGVRLALTRPEPYVQANLVGFVHLLEACRAVAARHLVYASSSSVYGANARLPFSEHHGVDHPVSLYAATKRANELMAHSYAHLFGLPTTGLRFFTVYGPWGRPDMAVYRFTDRIARGLPIEVAAGGQVRRDFTYVDDIVEALVGAARRPPAADPSWDRLAADPATSAAPWRVYNIGGNRPESLDRLIGLIETELGQKAIRHPTALPPGDVEETRADTGDLERLVGAKPAVSLEDGIARFVAWYRAEGAAFGPVQ
ncbi:MAG: NAD-dependent epimerase/dehydratase family protein [Methylobacteriaceae bacterium]|nr:NAD-dependent epimerase/dehydratase family protein [Methylobacteriaceae bacterium]